MLFFAKHLFLGGLPYLKGKERQIMKKEAKIIAAILAAISSVLGVLIQVTSGRLSASLCFLSVGAVVFAAMLLRWLCDGSPYLLLGLAFTLCSDFMLVLMPSEYRLPSMITFSLAQLCYFLLVLREESRGRVKKIHVITRIFASFAAIAATIFVLGDGADALALISMFYFANLICNALFSFLLGKQRLHLFIGLVLFVLCDTAVGLSVIEEYVTLKEGTLLYMIAHPSINLAWLFYVPSQTLIAISAMKKKTL